MSNQSALFYFNGRFCQLYDHCSLDSRKKIEEKNGDTSDVKIESEIPVFEYEAIKDRLMGDEDLLRVVIEKFITDMAEQFESLELAIVSEDVEKSTSQLHKIKGASANVGGMALSEEAREMEHFGKDDDFSKLKDGMTELIEQLRKLEKAIEERLA